MIKDKIKVVTDIIVAGVSFNYAIQLLFKPLKFSTNLSIFWIYYIRLTFFCEC